MKIHIHIKYLTGNAPGDLDTFLLNSTKYTQEEREVVMSAVSDWLDEEFLN